MLAKLDKNTCMQGLGLADEVDWRSLTKEVIEAHDTKNMIPHPKIPGGFKFQAQTSREESALAVGRIIQADSINSTQRWQHFPHHEWLIEALLAIAKSGFLNRRRLKSRTPKENRKAERGSRPRPYSGYRQASSSPEPNPHPASLSAPTQVHTPFATSHISTSSIEAADFPLASSASPL
jgi:hypothetical protein